MIGRRRAWGNLARVAGIDRAKTLPMMKPTAAIVLAVAFFAPRPAHPCSPPEEDDFKFHSVPANDSAPFPHDASPLVIVGHRFLDSHDLEARAAIFDSDGVEVPVDLDVSDRSGYNGGEDWIRLHPVEPLAADARFTIRLMAPEGEEDFQEDLDRALGDREFITGRSFIEDTPEPVAFSMQVLDHPGTPLLPGPCAPGGAPPRRSIQVSTEAQAEDAGAYDIWRFFEADSVGGDLSEEDHAASVEASGTRFDTDDLTSWTTGSEGDDEICVTMVTEDAYGRTSAASEACSEPIPSCAADCSAVGDRTSASLASLLLLGILGARRLRRESPEVEERKVVTSPRILMMGSVLVAYLTCGCGVMVTGIDEFGETASVVLLRSEVLPEASDDPFDSSQDEVRNTFILSTVENFCAGMVEAVAAADLAEQERDESFGSAGPNLTEAQYEAIDAVYYEAMAAAFLPVRGAGEHEFALHLGTYDEESRVYGEPREDTFVEQDQWWREEDQGARDVATPSNDLWFEGYSRYFTLDPYTVDIVDRPLRVGPLRNDRGRTLAGGCWRRRLEPHSERWGTRLLRRQWHPAAGTTEPRRS